MKNLAWTPRQSEKSSLDPQPKGIYLGGTPSQNEYFKNTFNLLFSLPFLLFPSFFSFLFHSFPFFSFSLSSPLFFPSDPQPRFSKVGGIIPPQSPPCQCMILGCKENVQVASEFLWNSSKTRLKWSISHRWNLIFFSFLLQNACFSMILTRDTILVTIWP